MNDLHPTSNTYQVHPKCAGVRDMNPEEYRNLRDSIERFGFDPAFPIYLYEGMIIDGRHRFKACQELGIAPVFYDWVPNEHDSPELIVLRSLARRHLTASEVAAHAVEVALPEQEAKAAARMMAGKKDPTQKVAEGEAVQVVAKAAGVNKQYIKDAKKLKDNAPEEFVKVKAGEKSLSQAKRDAAELAQPVSAQTNDPAGRIVTEQTVKDALAERDWFEDVCNRLHGIKREIIDVAKKPEGRALRIDQIELEIKNAVEAVRFAMPYTSCPYTTCNLSGCKACYGSRWVTRNVWENIPQDIRETGQ